MRMKENQENESILNESKKRESTIKRMVDSYRKRKRQEKIDKLVARTGGKKELWKGLESKHNGDTIE